MAVQQKIRNVFGTLTERESYNGNSFVRQIVTLSEFRTLRGTLPDPWKNLEVHMSVHAY